MKAYKLLKDMPGLKAGVVFLHDKHDRDKGSIGHGCLKLAWDTGNCQGDGRYSWCANTHILPGQLKNDKEWFLKIRNEKVLRNGELKKRYTC